MRTVFALQLDGRNIKLDQYENDKFAILSGAEYNVDLTYVQAAEALGTAIMHALVCEGRIKS